MGAPVCHVNTSNVPLKQPPPVQLPSIPVPTANLQSLLATVQVLKKIVERLAGQIQTTPPGQVGAVTPRVQTTPAGGAGSNRGGTSARWTVVDQQTEKVKVTNPQDSSQFVIVQRTTRLVLQDSVTGEQWVYTHA